MEKYISEIRIDGERRKVKDEEALPRAEVPGLLEPYAKRDEVPDISGLETGVEELHGKVGTAMADAAKAKEDATLAVGAAALADKKAGDAAAEAAEANEAAKAAEGAAASAVKTAGEAADTANEAALNIGEAKAAAENAMAKALEVEKAVNDGYKHVVMTEEEYEALEEKDAKTVYMIYEEE